jgi:hypothetical protein
MKTLAMKLLFGLTALFVTATAMAAGIAEVTGFDFEAVRYTIMGMGLLVTVPAGALAVMSSADIQEFKDQFGAYYQPRGQNAERLRKLLMYDNTPFESQFTLMPLEGDVLEYGLTSHDRVLQPFKPVWSPTGQLGGTPRKITLQRVKVNVEEIPDYLVNTWLGFLTTEGKKDPNINRATWPFVRWYVEMYLIPKAKEDQYMEAYYGIYADPGTNSTPGAEGTSLDGLAKKINVDIDNGDLTPISTGALDTDPELFVDQTEDFAEQMMDRYRGQRLVINMHDTFAQLFKTGMLEKYNVNYAQVADGGLMQLRKRTNISVMGHHNFLTDVGGDPSQKLICSPAGNLLKLARVESKEDSALRLEQVDYKLKMFNDWHVAYDYFDPRILFTNDVELTHGV